MCKYNQNFLLIILTFILIVFCCLIIKNTVETQTQIPQMSSVTSDSLFLMEELASRNRWPKKSSNKDKKKQVDKANWKQTF